MRRFLVLIGVSFLGAEISHAQESFPIPAEVLFQVATRAKSCSYEIQKVSLDNKGREKSEWKKPKGTSDTLKKLVSGDGNYMRALNSLVGLTSIDTATGVPTRIQGKLAEELQYGMGLFKLQKLNILLEQSWHGDKWLPSNFELEIKYWRMTILFMNVHDKYRAKFDCSAEMAAK